MNRMPYGGFVIWIFINLFLGIASASLGDICKTDGDCALLTNAYCYRKYECLTGTCACRSGYGNSNGNGCEKMLRGYGSSCGTDYYCNGVNQECNSVTKRCSCKVWYEYSSLAHQCKLMTYRLLTEVCGTWWNYECLSTISDTGGQCSNDRCSCKDGYIADTSESYTTCRAPRWGERCLSKPKCVEAFDSSTVSDDTSSIAPTCSNNICTCPPSHQHTVVNGYNLCLNKAYPVANFVRYNNGENCTHFNECQSSLCIKCPGATTGVCMAQSGAVPTFTAKTIFGLSSNQLIQNLLTSLISVLFFL